MGTPNQNTVHQMDKENAAIMVTDRDVEAEVENGAASLNLVTPALEIPFLGSNQNQIEREDTVENRAEVEATTVFQLLPEIWNSIFRYLQPKDFESIINASPVFRTFFESERTRRLLPLWLPVFLKKVGIREASALLRWRGVNKTAKSIVDNLLEESSSPQNYHDINSIDAPHWTPVFGSGEDELRLVVEKIKTCYMFRNPTEAQLFMDQMDSTSAVGLANPFLTKSLGILVSSSMFDEPAIRLLHQLILSMVQKYGHLISSLCVGGTAFYDRPSLDIPFLLSILRQLPKLKVVTIYADIRPSYEDDIAAVRLPPVQLNQLELLDVRMVQEDQNGLILPPLSRSIGPHLQRLICHGDFFKCEANLRTLRGGGHPNLRSFQVDFIDTESLYQLSTLGLPLQEIGIWGLRGVDVGGRQSNFTDVCESLRRFADTLVHLSISNWVDESDIGIQQPFPILSKFTTDFENLYRDWFRTFIRIQAQQLTELNFWYGDMTLGVHVMAELQRICESVPNLKRITIFRGVHLGMFRDNIAEKIIIERGQITRRIRYKHSGNLFPFFFGFGN